jgi:DNA-binding transcriptional MerR regulator
MLNEEKKLKTYYTIREVSEMFNITESTLRYWESEFPHLKPRTVKTSRVRMYAAKDLEDLKIIYNLVKVRGFKLAAAKKVMQANRTGVDRTAEIIDKLLAIKEELLLIKSALEKIV